MVAEGAGPVHRTKRGNGPAGDRPVDLFSADDALAAPYMMNLDPRQGTLDGFEAPAEALASQTERAALGVSGPAVQDPAQPEPTRADGDTVAVPMARVHKDPVPAAPGIGDAVSVDEVRPPAGGAAPLPSTGLSGAPAAQGLADTSKGAAAKQGPADRPDESNTSGAPKIKTQDDTPQDDTPSNLAPSRRQTPAPHPAERAVSVGRTPDAPSSDALAQAVAELQATLANERHAAHESRRRTTWLVSTAILLLLLVLVLGVVQVVVSVQASRESAAAQEKTEAFLRAQQTDLAALSGAVSLSAKPVAPPVRTVAAPPFAVKRAPRAAHKANVKSRSSTANDAVQTPSPLQAVPWRIGTNSTTAPVS